MNTQAFRIAGRVAARSAFRPTAATPRRLYSSSSASAPADWSAVFHRVRNTGVIYVPAALVLLGWPLAAAEVIDRASS